MAAARIGSAGAVMCPTCGAGPHCYCDSTAHHDAAGQPTNDNDGREEGSASADRPWMGSGAVHSPCRGVVSPASDAR